MSAAVYQLDPATPVTTSTSETGFHFPTLSEMGITRFSEISQYTLRQDGENKDTLKVHYQRAKGSLLPSSRKYRFGRSLKTVLADGGRSRVEDTYEISPYLLRAISELDALLARRETGVGRKQALLEELQAFEQQSNQRLAELRRQIESL